MSKKKANWEKLLDKFDALPKPKPELADAQTVEGMQQAFPWAEPSTLQWLVHHLHFVAYGAVEVLEEKFKPKRLHPLAKWDFQKSVQNILLEYIRDDMELWEANVKKDDDLLTQEELNALRDQWMSAAAARGKRAAASRLHTRRAT
jgi:hypothetical protein